MKIDVSKPLVSITGDTFKDEKNTDLTVKEMARMVLLNAPEKEESKALDPKNKMHRYDLALKISMTEKFVDINSEDIALMKKLAVSYPVGIYGSFVNYLEGNYHAYQPKGDVYAEPKKEPKAIPEEKAE